MTLKVNYCLTPNLSNNSQKYCTEQYWPLIPSWIR